MSPMRRGALTAREPAPPALAASSAPAFRDDVPAPPLTPLDLAADRLVAEVRTYLGDGDWHTVSVIPEWWSEQHSGAPGASAALSRAIARQSARQTVESAAARVAERRRRRDNHTRLYPTRESTP